MKQFLVPTDFSNLADRAVVFATKLAIKQDAQILFLHAYEVPFVGAGAGSMRNIDHIHREDANKKLLAFSKRMTEEYPALKFKTYNDASLPVDSIITHCKDNNYDLVVMGTAGTSNVVENFIGSTTSNVIGKINAPLLAIPGVSSMDFPKRFLVATDFKVENFLECIKPLYEMAKNLDATIDFVKVTSPNSPIEISTEEDLRNMLGVHFGKIEIVENEDIEIGLTNYVDESGADLLAVISQHKGFWEKLWNKSISKAIVKHTSVPVIVLPEA